MDEMTQMTESILSNNTAEVERLTAVFLSESFDTPMFSWEWRDNPKESPFDRLNLYAHNLTL